MTRPGPGKLFSAFAVVGTIGFVVDATVFQLLFTSIGGYVLPRVLAAGVAIIVTWYLHRRFVFRTSKAAAPGAEFLKYITVQSSGIVTNFAVYAALLGVFAALRSTPIIAVAAGSLCAMAVNFAGAKNWVFTDAYDPENEARHD